MEIETFPTPDLSHFSYSDYLRVYEPREDTFLLLDALNQERKVIEAMNPKICVEVGSGSGCVLTFLAQMLQQSNIKSYFLATDISVNATKAILSTAKQNGIQADVVHTDLLSGLQGRLANQVDILIFNPPYVPSTSEELKESRERNLQGEGIDLAWAGGIDGREILDQFLPLIPDMLSPGGKCYLIVLKENNPKEIVHLPFLEPLKPKVVIHRRNVSEHLFVLKFTKPV